MSTLNPAAEFVYSPRVRELFADLSHAGILPVGATHASPSGIVEKGEACLAPTLVSVEVGSREQGAQVSIQLALQGSHIRAACYQAYGCPHFLAACELLARWLNGRSIVELPLWSWRGVEAELQVPANKRARLLLLEEALQKIAQRCVK